MEFMRPRTVVIYRTCLRALVSVDHFWALESLRLIQAERSEDFNKGS